MAFKSEVFMRVESPPAPPMGSKDTAGKVPFDLLPLSALESLARAMEYGAGKYGRDNFKKGLSKSNLIGAAVRHIAKLQSGEERDPESGVDHAGHAMANLLIYEYLRIYGGLHD